jgi:TPR repeat protein
MTNSSSVGLQRALDMLNSQQADMQRRAYRVLLKAAAAGDAQALYWQAYCLAHGIGVPESRKDAIALLELHCGSAGPHLACAQSLLGRLLLQAGGASATRGAQLLERAVFRGEVSAHVWLARAYARGIGVPLDLSKAYAHAAEAATKDGSDDARLVFAQVSSLARAKRVVH